MGEPPVVESDEKPERFLDDVPGNLGSLESLDASHHVGLPTRIAYQVDASFSARARELL
jgi:hypothetical protein